MKEKTNIHEMLAKQLLERMYFPGTIAISFDGRCTAPQKNHDFYLFRLHDEMMPLLIKPEEWRTQDINQLHQRINTYLKKIPLEYYLQLFITHVHSLLLNFKDDTYKNFYNIMANMYGNQNKKTKKELKKRCQTLWETKRETVEYTINARNIFAMLIPRIRNRHKKFTTERFEKIVQLLKSKYPVNNYDPDMLKTKLHQVLNTADGYANYFYKSGGIIIVHEENPNIGSAIGNKYSTEILGKKSVLASNHIQLANDVSINPFGIAATRAKLIEVTALKYNFETPHDSFKRPAIFSQPVIFGKKLLVYASETQPIIENSAFSTLTEELHDYFQNNGRMAPVTSIRKLPDDIVKQLKQSCTEYTTLANAVINGETEAPIEWANYLKAFPSTVQKRQLVMPLPFSEDNQPGKQINYSTPTQGTDVTYTMIGRYTKNSPLALLEAPAITNPKDPKIIAYVINECAHQILQSTTTVEKYYKHTHPIAQKSEIAGKLTRLLMTYGPVAEIIIGKKTVNLLKTLNTQAKTTKYAPNGLPELHQQQAHHSRQTEFGFQMSKTINEQTFEPNPTLLKSYSKTPHQNTNASTKKLTKLRTPKLKQHAYNKLISQQDYLKTLTGALDSEYEIDSLTGEPIFTYNILQNGFKEGYLKLYGQPIICRSEDGDRHNIIEFGDITKEWELKDTKSFENICRVLPPTLFDKVYMQATTSFGHGVRRGLSNVIAIQLQSRGLLSKLATKALSEFLDCSSYFMVRYWQHANSEQNPLSNFTALYKAAWETGSYFIFNQTTRFVCHTLSILGNNLTQRGWSKTGSALRTLGKYGGLVVPAYHAKTNDPITVATSVVVGNVAQKSVEHLLSPK